MRSLTGRASVYAVFGWPVGHSLSPVMHNAAFRALDMDAVYVPFAVCPEALAAAFLGVRALGLVGINLTVPLKEAALGLVDKLSPYAACIGAINTVHNVAGVLVGHNTDGEGFMAPLREIGFDVLGKNVLVAGAGGAARSVVFTLVDRGARVTLVNRTSARAEALAADVHARTGRDVAVVLPGPQVDPALRLADLVVNATTVGMVPHEHDDPPFEVGALHEGMVVYDLVYRPRETRLLAAAKSAGARTLDGLGMLVNQGAASFEIWTGVRPPVAEMEAALEDALGFD